MSNDEARINDEARMTNVLAAQSFGSSHNLGLRYLLLQIFEKIRCSSFASSHRVRAWGFNSGIARAIIRRKCFVSRASLRQVPILFRNSFLETASSAST